MVAFFKHEIVKVFLGYTSVFASFVTFAVTLTKTINILKSNEHTNYILFVCIYAYIFPISAKEAYDLHSC